MYVLDTNVVAELRKVKSGKAHPNVAAWNNSVAPSQAFVSAITVFGWNAEFCNSSDAMPHKGWCYAAGWIGL